MAPKKAAAATTGTKKAAAPSAHPTYQEMIKEAIINLKDRNGSSRQAIKKYVQANNNLSGISDNVFTAQFNRALQKGSESGVFARPKGTSGPVKLAAPKASESKPAAAKAPAKAKTTKTTTAATKKAPAAKKSAAAKTSTSAAATTKKAPATKKAATTTAKTSTAATKSKANTGKKVRKTPSAAAPAVEDKAPVVLGKTKSGRVTKSTAPQAGKASASKKKAAGATAKKPATKKATPKKA